MRPHRNSRRTPARTTPLLGGCEPLEPRQVMAVVLSMQGPTDVLFEGEKADFTLRLSEPSSQAQSVFVTTRAVTATLGVDYMAPARQQIIFSPGQTVKTFSIATLKEAVPRAEGIETFIVTATPANPDLPGVRNATVRIADFQAPPAISVADISVAEGSTGTTPATFTIQLSAAFAKRVTVNYATRDGSATAAGGDYVAVTGSLEFAPGETSKTVTVNVNGDRVLEGNETFSLVISSPVNATIGRGTGVCTIRNDETDQPGFQITLNFIDSPLGAVPPAVRSLAQQAVDRWTRVIIGDLPGVVAGGLFIDDLEMSVQMGLLGGAPNGNSGILANASPVDFRPGPNGLPYTGITGLNPFYTTFNTLEERNFLLDTITHEIGHALGFAPGTDFYDRYVVGNSFTGPNAVREYNTLFGVSAATVPLEPGSLSHWSEAIFNDELMSPIAEPLGVREYISTVTIGALQDMGYSVSYAAAEPYQRPSRLAPPTSGGGLSRANDTVPIRSGRGAPIPSPESPNPGPASASAAIPVEWPSSSPGIRVPRPRAASSLTPGSTVALALSARVFAAHPNMFG